MLRCFVVNVVVVALVVFAVVVVVVVVVLFCYLRGLDLTAPPLPWGLNFGNRSFWQRYVIMFLSKIPDLKSINFFPSDLHSVDNQIYLLNLTDTILISILANELYLYFNFLVPACLTVGTLIPICFNVIFSGKCVPAPTPAFS